MCSDLDEQEGEMGEGEGERSGECNGEIEFKLEEGEEEERESRQEEEVEGSGEEEEEELDGYTAGEESGSECFSDEEVQTFSRSSKRHRLLDSEEEEEEEVEEEKGDHIIALPTLAPHTQTNRISSFRVASDVKTVLEPALLKQASVCADEPSMGPLILNESLESESSALPPLTTANDIEGGGGGGGGRRRGGEGKKVERLGVASEAMTSEPSLISLGSGLVSPSSPHRAMLPEDSGIGKSLKEREEEEEEERGTRSELALESDRDFSLEGSLLLAPSLAPAQPPREDTNLVEEAKRRGVVMQGKGEGEGGSQWPGATQDNTQGLTDTQSVSMYEETQFLDANGYVP